MTMSEDVPAAPEKPTRPRRSALAKAAKGASPKSVGPKSARKSAAPAAHTGHGWMWAAMVALAMASGGSVAGLWFLESAARDAQNKHLESVIQAELQTVVAGQPAPGDAGKLAALDARIGAVEKHVTGGADSGSIKETEAATALLVEKIEGLSGRIGDVEKELAQIKTSGAGPGDTAALESARQEAKKNADELAALKDRLAAIEQSQHTNASTASIQRNQTLVVAVGQLREALGSAKPFSQELATVTSLGDADVSKIVEPIASYADKGIATVSDLRGEFPQVAAAVVQAQGAPQSGGWVNKALSEAGVSVRKVGPVEGTSPEAIVARAEDKLSGDDLDGALSEMSALSQTPPAADAWLEKAKARQAAEHAMKDLHLRVIGQIAQSDGSSK